MKESFSMKKTYKIYTPRGEAEGEYNLIPARYIIALILAALEFLSIIGILLALCYYVPYFYILCWITEIACIIKIVASDDNPDFKIPWLIVVMVIPVAGFMLYFMFSKRTLNKKYIRRLAHMKEHSYEKDDSRLFASLAAESETAAAEARMLCGISESHLFSETKTEYFPLGEEMFARMLEDLSSAERFIYMEYFIIEPGKFWNSILEILKKKAEGGVEVKVLYDDIGCVGTLPGNYFMELREYGIEAAPFSILRGSADSEFNNRSHRKICIIDGKVGYTGGVNIADEYINEVVRFGHWKDTAIRLEGEAVFELTKLFLIDYGINVRNAPEIRPDLYPESKFHKEKMLGASCQEELCEGNAEKEISKNKDGYLVPFGDGPRPMYERRVGKSVIQNLLAGAKKYVWMTTPYLIIDNDLCTSIENAALRGVDVRIIVPHIPDKKLVFGVTRSFYHRLMAAGVRIYEYEPGFIHAKSYLADDERGMIGTINLDYRSLVHHFENGVWMYKCAALQGMHDDMVETMEKSIEVTPDMLKTNILVSFVRSVVRIFAPML